MEKKKGLYAVLVVLVFLALSGKTMYDRVSSPAETFREGSGEPRQELTLVRPVCGSDGCRHRAYSL